MVEKLHSREMHDELIDNIAHGVVSGLGPMPRDVAAADKWEQDVKQILSRLHERYKGDWEKAFEFDQAFELVKTVGRELADQEVRVSETQGPAVATLSAVQAKPKVGKTTMPNFPSVSDLPTRPGVRPRAKTGSSALGAVGQPETDALSLVSSSRRFFERPWVMLGVGVVIGLAVGGWTGRFLASRG